MILPDLGHGTVGGGMSLQAQLDAMGQKCKGRRELENVARVHGTGYLCGLGGGSWCHCRHNLMVRGLGPGTRYFVWDRGWCQCRHQGSVEGQKRAGYLAWVIGLWGVWWHCRHKLVPRVNLKGKESLKLGLGHGAGYLGGEEGANVTADTI